MNLKKKIRKIILFIIQNENFEIDIALLLYLINKLICVINYKNHNIIFFSILFSYMIFLI